LLIWARCAKEKNRPRGERKRGVVLGAG